MNHPARVAERVAMMDLVSSGRFEFGTGRGSSTTEMGGFGITDPEITRDMYDEAIREIVRMWRDEPYSYDGKFFSMPERNVLPKPYVKPHPPLWVAAGNPETFEKAARMGLGVICFTGGTPEKMAPLVETYKKHIVNAEPVGEYVNDNIAITTSFMCLEDRDEARNYMAHSGNGRQQTLVFHYLDTFPKPPFVPRVARARSPTRRSTRSRRASRAAPRSSARPTTARQGIQKWVDIGVDQLIMGPSGSTYPHELLERTVTLFGDEVIPRFDTDPEHSTSKYRAAAAVTGLMVLNAHFVLLSGAVTGGLEHPDLAGVGSEMRAEWRAEQEAATADAAAAVAPQPDALGLARGAHARRRPHRGHGRRPALHRARRGDRRRPDRVAVRVRSRRRPPHSGACRSSIEIHDHATSGGDRARTRRSFHDALDRTRRSRRRHGRHDPRPRGPRRQAVRRRATSSRSSRKLGAETVVPLQYVTWVSAGVRASRSAASDESLVTPQELTHAGQLGADLPQARRGLVVECVRRRADDLALVEVLAGDAVDVG